MNRYLKFSVMWVSALILFEMIFPLVTVAQDDAVPTGIKFRTVALTREPAIGLDEGVMFGKGGWPQGFGNASVDSKGRAAFQAGLKAKGLIDSYSSSKEFANDEAFYLETDGGLQMLLRKGDAVLQDNPKLKLNYVQNCYSGDGKVIVLARLSDKPRGGDTSYGVFTNFGGKFRPILKTGDPAIGVEGTFSVFEGVHSDVDFSNGIFTFRSPVMGVPDAKRNPVGLWTGKPGDMKLLAATGQSAPGMDAEFKFTGFSDFQQNAAGQVVFSATSKGSRAGELQTGIWLASAGETPKLVAQKGDVLTGLPEGVTLDRISTPKINDAGQIAAFASFKLPSGKPSQAMLFADENGARAVMQTGQKIAGTTEPVGGFKQFNISSSGMLAVEYLWTPADEKGFKQGLVLVDPQNSNSPELIAKAKTQIPGAADGVAFGPFGPQISFVDGERIVFSTTASDRKSYTLISKRGGEPDLIAYPEMEIEIRPGEKKKVTYAGFWRGASIADSDGVAAYLPFAMRFNDRTCGMLVAEVASQ